MVYSTEDTNRSNFCVGVVGQGYPLYVRAVSPADMDTHFVLEPCHQQMELTSPDVIDCGPQVHDYEKDWNET